MSIIPFPIRKLPIRLGKKPASTSAVNAAIAAAQEPEKPAVATEQDGLKALQWLYDQNFMGTVQFQTIKLFIKTSEEAQFFIDKMIEMKQLIENMPHTYQQEGKGEETMVYLHYFHRSYDGYIIEKDSNKEAPGADPAERQWQAYGFARFEHMPECAECGYICLPEILKAGAELDLHFTPTKLTEIKAKYEPQEEPENFCEQSRTQNTSGEAAGGLAPGQFQTPSNDNPPPPPAPTPEPTPSPSASEPTEVSPDKLRKIKDRLAKLLRLGENSAASDGEIENALRMATKLMAEHQISREDIDTESLNPTQRLTIGRHIAIAKGKNLTMWEKVLGTFITNFINTVQAYCSNNIPLRRHGIAMLDGDGNARYGSVINFYGPDEDAEIAAEMFTEIRDDIVRMAILRFGNYARKDGSYYALGFVQSLIDEHRNATHNLMHSEASHALILKSNATALSIRKSASDWLTTQGVTVRNSTKKTTVRINPSAYNEGRTDGKNYTPNRPTVKPKLN